MFRTTLAKRITIVAASAALAAVAILTTSALAGRVTGESYNLRPICNDFGFNMPGVGESVTISIRPYAADPDLTPIRLVSAANYGAQIGTVRVVGDHEFEFTLTSSTPGAVWLYWTITDDGSLTTQCFVYGSNEREPDNG